MSQSLCLKRRGEKRALENKRLRKPSASWRRGLVGLHIKQAIQGLFTAGTSEKKEKVGGKRGLKPLSFLMKDVQGCPNNPAGYKLYKQ